MDYHSVEVTIVGKKRLGGKTRVENQDRFAKRILPAGEIDLLLLLVADGVTQQSDSYGHSRPSFGRVAAQFVCDNFTKDFSLEGVPETQHVNRLLEFAEALPARFVAWADELGAPLADDIKGSATTVSLALLGKSGADCFWTGDSPIFVSRTGAAGLTTELISIPDRDPAGRLTARFSGVVPFRPKHRFVPLNSGDILTLASDGVPFDSVALNSAYEQNGFGVALLNAVRGALERRPYHDDATLLAARKSDDAAG